MSDVIKTKGSSPSTQKLTTTKGSPCIFISSYPPLSPSREDTRMENTQCYSIQILLTLAVRDMYIGQIYFNSLHTVYQIQFTPARFG